MERFNFKGVQRFWTIAKAYWFGEEKWKARGLLLLIMLLLLAYTGLSVVLNTQRGELISSLSGKDESRFWQTVATFIGVLVVYAPLLAGYTYLRDRLGLEWRRWLTDRFVNQYFRDRAFYRIHQFDSDIDNPDQRIAEDVKSFTQESLLLVLVVIGSVLEVIAFSRVLWGISRELVIFLVVYAVLGSLVAIGVFGKPLVRLNFEQLKREADFRFGLVRIRENAEAIAFYQGEDQEATQVKNRFIAAFDNFKRLLLWELNLNGLTNTYEFIPFILPALVVAPAVFGGDLEVGKVSEAQGAFIRVFFSLNIVVARFQSLTAFGAGIDRLYGFAEAIGYGEEPAEEEIRGAGEAEEAKEAEGERGKGRGKGETGGPEDEQLVIQQTVSPVLSLQHLTLQTPNYQRTLVEDLSFELKPDSSLLIVGPSGCGKSSLLRAIAGLWNSGQGEIQRPELKHLLFLPQKPYMILGSLRQQLLYPYPDVERTDEQLRAGLEKVNLPNLEERFGGFAAEEDWGDVLSLGEQQRLSFARVLLHEPTYVILDEATSALDRSNEALLYSHLADTSTAYLSVGHRESLEAHHRLRLQLAEDHTWQLNVLSSPEETVALTG